MIISRAPVRFSLGGGGTDLPSYAKQYGGFVVGAAIDKYVFVAANPRFYDSIRLSYSKTEIVDSVAEIQHPIFREALRYTNISKGIELVSVADVPSNSGLGSSSSFTVALLNALHVCKGEFVSRQELAAEAATIEIGTLQAPIGPQDQCMAALGGIHALIIETNGTTVNAEPIPIRPEVQDELESSLLVFYSGIERQASTVLSEQASGITANLDGAVERMHRIKALGHETYRILVNGTLDEYGELLHEHWTNKRKLASNMTSDAIDEHYEAARKAGAIGGKLMGAGGGGFFMFYVRPESRRSVYDAMKARGLKPLRFRFDSCGARIVANVHQS